MSGKIPHPWNTQAGSNLCRQCGDTGNKTVQLPQGCGSVSGDWSQTVAEARVRIQSIFHQIDLCFFHSFRMTMYLKWGIFSVQNGQILTVLLAKPLNWSASSKRKLPTAMDPWLYMMSKHCSLQLFFMLLCRAIYYLIYSESHWNKPQSLHLTTVLLLLFQLHQQEKHLVFIPLWMFSIQLSHFYSPDNCRVGHWRRNLSGLHCVLLREVRLLRWSILPSASCLTVVINTEM